MPPFCHTGADGAAAFLRSCPGINDGFPHMAIITLPPRSPVRTGRDHLRSQGAIEIKRMGRFLTKNYDAPSVRHTTCEAHRYVLKNHILPWIGDCPLESLTTQKIEEFLEEHQLHGNKRNGKPLSQQTMRHIQNLLSKVLSQAVNRGLIERNPVQGICRSAPKQVKATILADNEIRDYLSAAKDFHKLTERVLMEDLYDRTPHILDHAITILLG